MRKNACSKGSQISAAMVTTMSNNCLDPLRHGDGEVHAATDIHRANPDAATGERIGHQAVGQKGVQGDDGFRVDDRMPRVVHQIFDGGLVIEDHLGFQGILALGGLAEFDQPLCVGRL